MAEGMRTGAAAAATGEQPFEASARQRAARAWLHEAGGPCRVKLCGMFRPADIDVLAAMAAAGAAPDLVGFIVDFPRSHRSLAPEELAALTARMAAAQGAGAAESGAAAQGADAAPWRVGVFVDQPAARVARIAAGCGLDLVQLHGHETAADVRALQAAAPGLGIIQAFRAAAPADVACACESPADMILLDSGQGSGETFDWSLAAAATRPFLLAGGLGPGNVARAIEQVRPWGVDMSSGIETDKLKDPGKMEAAVAAVRAARGL